MLNDEILHTLRALLDAARASPDPEPTAMTLATAGAGGRVSARVLLLKGVDARGVRFFTHYESDKGAQIAAHPQVALCLQWKHLTQPTQVRIEGRAVKLPAAESDAYFATRERGSQLGAWASLQSRTLPDRDTLMRRIAEREREFAGREVPRPPEWGGYLVEPDMVEFWYGVEHRYNERVRWELRDGRWAKRLLYP